MPEKKKTNYERGGIQLSTLAVSYPVKDQFKKYCVNQGADMRPSLDHVLRTAIKDRVKLPKK